jgi:cytochrome c-type biogenesis protein CcmH
MKPLLLLLSVCWPLLTGAYAPQQAGSAPLDPAREARVQSLGKELRCAVCQGLSIADSPASMARAQLDKVREMVAAGKTDEEIRAYFVARYGEWVLLNPKAAGFNWLVWLSPAALLVVGLVIIIRQVRHSSKESASRDRPNTNTESAGTAPAPSAAPEDEYLKRVRSELER